MNADGPIRVLGVCGSLEARWRIDLVRAVVTEAGVDPEHIAPPE